MDANTAGERDEGGCAGRQTDTCLPSSAKCERTAEAALGGVQRMHKNESEGRGNMSHVRSTPCTGREEQSMTHIHAHTGMKENVLSSWGERQG